MHKLILHPFVGMLLTLAPLTLTACEPAGATCKEECEIDEDCGAGLICAGDKTCVVSECRACWDAGEVCFQNQETLEDGTLECTFTECR